MALTATDPVDIMEKERHNLLMLPTTPRAPVQTVWDQLSPEEQVAVVNSLPAWMSDEELPPPEGDSHFEAKTSAKDTLRAFFRHQARGIYITCDLTVYYPNEARFAPDLFVVCDVDPHERMKWVVSAEGKGLDFVMEVLVAGDWRKDRVTNLARYARLKIPEYFIYDRRRRELAGFRLPRVDATAYEPIGPDARGRLFSQILGLGLVIEQQNLRFYQGTAVLLSPEELIERLGRLAAEMEARADARAEEASARAEEASARAAEASAAAEKVLAVARSAVLRLLSRRGLMVTPELRARIENEADLPRLEHWLDLAATATSVNEVFLDD